VEDAIYKAHASGILLRANDTSKGPAGGNSFITHSDTRTRTEF